MLLIKRNIHELKSWSVQTMSRVNRTPHWAFTKFIKLRHWWLISIIHTCAVKLFRNTHVFHFRLDADGLLCFSMCCISEKSHSVFFFPFLIITIIRPWLQPAFRIYPQCFCQKASVNSHCAWRSIPEALWLQIASKSISSCCYTSPILAEWIL